MKMSFFDEKPLKTQQGFLEGPYSLTLKKLTLFLALIFCFAFASCNQDSIFYNISNEVAPIPPRIEGLTTDMVEVGGRLYVASMGSRDIQQYDGQGWNSPRNPGGTIRGLAATATHLYALTFDGIDPSGSKLKRKAGADFANADAWDTVSEQPGMQKVYAANNTVFVWAGTDKGVSGPLYAVNTAGNGLDPIGTVGMLNGAAYDGSNTYYFACLDGIYTYTSGSPSKVQEGIIMGIIKVKNQIVAAGRDTLYYNSSGSPSIFNPSSLGVVCTGAMGLWKEDASNTDSDLLLLGVQNRSYSNTEHGYREITLNNGELNTGNLTARQPGQESPTSSNNYGQYHSSIGTHPVVSILQFNGIFFAGTSRDGLWSYRVRDGAWQWNAEN
jgi:hypothetical protein